jgi:hypothetical protein
VLAIYHVQQLLFHVIRPTLQETRNSPMNKVCAEVFFDKVNQLLFCSITVCNGFISDHPEELKLPLIGPDMRTDVTFFVPSYELLAGESELNWNSWARTLLSNVAPRRVLAMAR